MLPMWLSSESVLVEHQGFGLSSGSKKVEQPKWVMPPMMKGKTQSVPFAGPEVVAQVESDPLDDLDSASFSPDGHGSFYICF